MSKNTTWTGQTDFDFQVDTNWDNGAPVAGDVAAFTGGGTINVTNVLTTPFHLLVSGVLSLGLGSVTLHKDTQITSDGTAVVRGYQQAALSGDFTIVASRPVVAGATYSVIVSANRVATGFVPDVIEEEIYGLWFDDLSWNAGTRTISGTVTAESLQAINGLLGLTDLDTGVLIYLESWPPAAASSFGSRFGGITIPADMEEIVLPEAVLEADADLILQL